MLLSRSFQANHVQIARSNSLFQHFRFSRLNLLFKRLSLFKSLLPILCFFTTGADDFILLSTEAASSSTHSTIYIPLVEIQIIEILIRQPTAISPKLCPIIGVRSRGRRLRRHRTRSRKQIFRPGITGKDRLSASLHVFESNEAIEGSGGVGTPIQTSAIARSSYASIPILLMRMAHLCDVFLRQIELSQRT